MTRGDRAADAARRSARPPQAPHRRAGNYTIQTTHMWRVRSHPRERGSGGAVRAARARAGGASAAAPCAIATRAPLRRALARHSRHHARHRRRARRGRRRRRRRPPRPAARRRAASRRCRSRWAPRGPPGAPSGTRKNPSEAADRRSATAGGVRAEVARAAHDVAGELGWRRKRLRRGGTGLGRLSSLREHRQKRARGAGEADRGTRAGVRGRSWRAGGRVRRARAGRPGAREAQVVDP